VNRVKLDEIYRDENTFQYALRNIMSEVFLDQFDAPRILSFIHKQDYCAVLIADEMLGKTDIQKGCEKLLSVLSQYFGSEGNCIIGNLRPLWELAKGLKRLESIDLNNVSETGKVLYEKQFENFEQSEKVSLDLIEIRQKLLEFRGAELINEIKDLLESLKNAGKLNHDLLKSILQDYLQVVYSVLIEHNILAHELFKNPTTEKMAEAAEYSVFEAMRWISYMTQTTIDYLQKTNESESIVEKIKRYIQDNYTQELSRETIAAQIYLTPNYVSKLFCDHTGEYLSDYISEVRLQKAKNFAFYN
jgi:two-component system response regulator YesN